MNSEFQKKLYELEIAPPQQVWEKLAAGLDEINADNLLANKILKAELIPPSGVWGKINDSLYKAKKSGVEKKGIVINLKKVVVAAICTGLILSAWLLFINPKQRNNALVTTQTAPSPDKINSDNKTEFIPKTAGIELKSSETNTTSFPNNKNNLPGRRSSFTQIAFTQAKYKEPSLLINDGHSVSIPDEKPSDKIFDQPIDDLSLVTTDEHYLTMVNANGRIVKIPTHLAYLAPRMQDKPVTEDYNEIMFGEGAFWKDKLNEWRYKLATSPVSSGDIFSNMVELLKSVQEK